MSIAEPASRGAHIEDSRGGLRGVPSCGKRLTVRAVAVLLAGDRHRRTLPVMPMLSRNSRYVHHVHSARQTVDTSRWWTLRWPNNAISLLGTACGLNTESTYKLLRVMRKVINHAKSASVLRGPSAGSPRGEAREGRAARESNAVTAVLRCRSRRLAAVSVRPSLGQRRRDGARRELAHTTTTSQVLSARAARLLRTVG